MNNARNLMGLQLLRQRRTRSLRAADNAVAQRRQSNWGAAYAGYDAEAGAYVARMPGGGTWQVQDVGGGAPGRTLRVSVNNRAYMRTKPRGTR